MKRCWAFFLATVISVTPLSAQELPSDGQSFEVEPPLLVQPDGRPVLPNESPAATPVATRDVAQLEKQLERAKKSAASAERLWKAGVLAKVETEYRALRVVRLQAEFAEARLAQVKERTATSLPSVQAGQADQAASAESKAALEQAAAAAQSATAGLAKAELDAAILNVQRQQKLLALGSARKSDVTRAKEKLAALKRGQ
jgi:hypothetical protein